MPPQGGIAWLSIVPVAESRSSYNGLLVFAFITVATLLAIETIHRFASRALRRGPAWDCGFPDPNPATQYTADSFAQPIRRVFGEVVFQARERVDMPPPGDKRPARHTVTLRDLVWDAIYAPIGEAVRVAADKLNNLQFLMSAASLDIAHMLAGSMVLVSFLLLYQDRMFGLLNVFALHAVVLSASVAWQAHIQNAPHLYVTAVIALVLKAIIIPVALRRVVIRLGIHRTIETVVGIGPTMQFGMVSSPCRWWSY